MTNVTQTPLNDVEIICYVMIFGLQEGDSSKCLMTKYIIFCGFNHLYL